MGGSPRSPGPRPGPGIGEKSGFLGGWGRMDLESLGILFLNLPKSSFQSPVNCMIPLVIAVLAQWTTGDAKQSSFPENWSHFSLLVCQTLLETHPTILPVRRRATFHVMALICLLRVLRMPSHGVNCQLLPFADRHSHGICSTLINPFCVHVDQDSDKPHNMCSSPMKLLELWQGQSDFFVSLIHQIHQV